MRIGVTGATGVLGRLVHALLRVRGFQPDSFDGDICSQSEVSHWVRNDYSGVIHLAAVVPTEEVKEMPFKAISVNVGGTINLLQTLHLQKLRPWIFYASTSHVYKPAKIAIKEDSAIDPISFYGSTKRQGEEACLAFSSQYKLSVCIGRIFSFFHETQMEPFLFPSWTKKLSKRSLEPQYEVINGEDIRDFSQADHIADSIVALLVMQATGVYNIGSGKGTRVIDFIQAINQSAKLIAIQENQPTMLVANVEKLQLLVGQHGVHKIKLL